MPRGRAAPRGERADGGFIKPDLLDLWYPAPDIDALARYLEGYEPHRYGHTWMNRTP